MRRNAEVTLRRYMEMFPVVAILGARQSGKTTLAKMICPDWHFFDLERSRDYDLITADFEFFFSQYSECVVIDEAQRSPHLFGELRGVIDRDRSKKGRFLLTGSSSPDLIRGLSESLAGRIGIIELGTLKMNERYGLPISPIYSMLNSLPATMHLEKLQELESSLTSSQVLESFLFGGYPEPVLEGTRLFHETWMAHYEVTYIERDIARLFPNLNSVNYRRFVRILSELSGTMVNRSDVGRTLCVSEPTIRDYLSIADGTFVWRILKSFEHSASRSVVRMPRGYIRDSGLLHYFRRVRDRDALLQHPKTGAAFEGFVIEELIQGLRVVESTPWDFSFYRTRNGAEVDLVMTSPDQVHIPVEIMFGGATKPTQLRSLAQFIEQENSPYGLVINQSEKIQMLRPKILQIPARYL